MINAAIGDDRDNVRKEFFTDEEITENEERITLPKIQKVTVLADMKLLVEVKNGVTKIYDTKKLLAEYDLFEPLKDPEVFSTASVDHNGSGVIWNADMDVSEWELWTNGVEVPLTSDDLNQYQANNSICTAEVCKILNCTRQNIDFLVKSRKIQPVMRLGNNKLFSKADIMAYKMKTDNEAYAKACE